MLFGYDGQMVARMKAYMQKTQDQQQADQVLRQNTVAAVTAPYERFGGKPTDGPSTVTDVATAVKRLAAADKHRSLITAIDILHSKRQSNGKPVVYVPE